MQDYRRTRQQLISELETARQRFAELESAEKKRKLIEELKHVAQIYGESIVSTVREPLLVLDSDLRVVSANRSFYHTFRVTPQETENTSSTSWETTSGTFPSCARCWKTSSPTILSSKTWTFVTISQT